MSPQDIVFLCELIENLNTRLFLLLKPKKPIQPSLHPSERRKSSHQGVPSMPLPLLTFRLMQRPSQAENRRIKRSRICFAFLCLLLVLLLLVLFFFVFVFFFGLFFFFFLLISLPLCGESVSTTSCLRCNLFSREKNLGMYCTAACEHVETEDECSR